MSYNNSKGSKQIKGVAQVFPTGPSGEPRVTTKMDYDGPCGNIQYMGEAKAGAKETDIRWYIERFQYDSYSNLICVEVACNILTTKATSVTVDTTSNPGFTRIEITGGTFFRYYVEERDKITLTTTNNTLRGKEIQQFLSDTEILIAGSATDETGTTITDTDLTITLNSENTKDFTKRRWDLRDFYFYA